MAGLEHGYFEILQGNLRPDGLIFPSWGADICDPAKLWPWPLVLLVGWLLAQFPVGYLFNDTLKSVMGWVLLFIVTFLPISVYVGYARDSVSK